jgi:small subunit ribosomal protein S23
MGNSVVQRQLYLMQNQGYRKQQAYDAARKEFYHYRHIEAVEQRVAREEAMATGAYFGKGPLEISMELEDKQFENWKAWALAEVEREKQLAGAAYTGNIDEEESSLVEAPTVSLDGEIDMEATAPVLESAPL